MNASGPLYAVLSLTALVGGFSASACHNATTSNASSRGDHGGDLAQGVADGATSAGAGKSRSGGNADPAKGGDGGGSGGEGTGADGAGAGGVHSSGPAGAGGGGTGGSAGWAGRASGPGGASSQGGVGGTRQGAGAAGQPQAGAGGTKDGGPSASGKGGSSEAGNAGDSAASAHAWNIMPLGDSITGTTCYPQLLSQKLKNTGRTNFQFIGTNLNNQSCTDGSITNAPTVKTEGHGCYILGCLTGDYTASCGASSGCDNGRGKPAELLSWLAATPPPEVVLVHFGTNDVWNNRATSDIIDSFTHLLASIRNANSKVIVFIAQILPMHPDNCTDGSGGCPNDGVKLLNAAIPPWASSASTADSPIYVVDIYGSIGESAKYVPNSSVTSDGVHPNAKGSALMADAWMRALAAQGIP